MTVPTPALVTARADAAAKRERFLSTLHEVQERLAPATIARNAWDNVRDKGEEVAGHTVDYARDKANLTIELAREQPAVAGTVAGLMAAFMVRKPVGRLVHRLFRRDRHAAPTPESLGTIHARAGD